MANQSKSQDPSMEDILASIRRIIVDDDDKATATADAPVEDNDDDDVLELTEVVEDELVTSEPETAEKPSILDITSEPILADETSEEDDEPYNDNLNFSEPSQTAHDGADETMANKPDQNDDRLMSQDTASSAATALSSLARASDPDPLHGVPQGRPVEELVMDALKPMLSEWLNEHLPAIVERIVEREVRYLSRRTQDD